MCRAPNGLDGKAGIPVGHSDGDHPGSSGLIPRWGDADESKPPSAKTGPVPMHAESERMVAPLAKHALGEVPGRRGGPARPVTPWQPRSAAPIRMRAFAEQNIARRG